MLSTMDWKHERRQAIYYDLTLRRVRATIVAAEKPKPIGITYYRCVFVALGI